MNHGCNGGSMDLAMMYTASNPLETEANYPYTAKTGRTCNYAKAQGVVSATKHTDVAKGNVAQLKAAVGKGPVSVAIEADQVAFQSYKSGILSKGCGTALDHGVLVVGYGSQAGQDYWIVKNSWGPSWGEKGFVRIAIQAGNGVCGIQMEPVQPTTN
jgi:C1A family cysteine protease